MMQKKFCDELHWVSDEEVLDMTAIAQSAPGALAVNSAIIFGYRMGWNKGCAGFYTCNDYSATGDYFVICNIYDAFSTNKIIQIALQVMRAGVAAVIMDVICSLGEKVFGKQKTGSIFV